MRGVNKVLLLGVVGDAPELRYTPTQQAICTFPLATHREVIHADGSSEQVTDWHTCVARGKRAEYFAGIFQKGSRVFVEGMLEYREVQHRKHKDVVQKKAHIEVQRVEFIDGLVSHEYPQDFPPLGKTGKTATTKKPAQSKIQKQDYPSDDLFGDLED